MSGDVRALRAAAIIDLNALAENVKLIRSRIAPGVRVLCVVKADAYGHGAKEVSKRLEACGVDFLGVANIDEGIELRDHGISLPVLVLGGLFPWDDAGRAVAHDLSLIVYDIQTLDRIRKESRSFAGPLKIHIKVDTGMGRHGFGVDDMGLVAERLKDAPNVVCEGLMSHFASSEARDEYGLAQIKTFEKARSLLVAAGVGPGIVHMANSGAVTQYPEAHFDMVRVGISLYGSHPDRELAGKLPVKPVMRFVSRVAYVRPFPEGCFLSYGRTYRTEGTERIALIPVGYADGYPRALSNKGFVLIKGKKCSIVGIVTMDWVLVDVTAIKDVDVGEEVVLIGSGPTGTITADELAECAGTIPYEILCKISRRVPRVYV